MRLLRELCMMLARSPAMLWFGLRHRVHLVASLLAVPISALSQMPGQPVIQNAFTNPGWAFGVNYGDSDEALGYGGAVGWGNGSAKLALSVGGGIWAPSDAESVFAWGTRALWSPLRFLD